MSTEQDIFEFPEKHEVYEFFTTVTSSIKGGIKLLGASNRKELLISGAIHGDEEAGPQAMLWLYRYLKANQSKLKGNIHFLLGNPEAFGASKRYIDNDLNRSFFPSSKNSYESKRANEIMKYVHENQFIQGVLDIHSVSLGDFQMAIYNISDRKIAESISPSPIHLIIPNKKIKGLFIDYCREKLSCFSMAVEVGNHYSIQGPYRALFHMLTFLKEMDVFTDENLINELSHFLDFSPLITRYEVIETITPNENFQFILPEVISDTPISKGMVYAKAGNESYISPADCFLLLPVKSPKMTDSEYGLLCSKEVLPRIVKWNI